MEKADGPKDVLLRLLKEFIETEQIVLASVHDSDVISWCFLPFYLKFGGTRMRQL